MEAPIAMPRIFPVTCHTNHVGPGSTFVAIRGMFQDGALYIPQALQLGATTIVVEQNHVLSPEIEAAIEKAQARLVRVEYARRALAQLSAEAHGHSAKKLKIIGITGTKGKSTTTFLVEHFLRSAGYKTALLSTVNNRILDQWLPTDLTTQQPDYLHVFFDLCVAHDVEYVVMEIAAQGLSLERVYGIEFDAGVFTNFSLEHGEFYPTQEEYLQAKCQLLTQLKPDAPMALNADDVRVMELYERCSRPLLFGSDDSVDAGCVVTAASFRGIQGFLSCRGKSKCYFETTQLCGDFNRYNLAAAALIAAECGIVVEEMCQALAFFPGVPGRFDRYTLSNGAAVCIDYAHNPSSFRAVLDALRPLTDHLIVVFGAGGGRDVSKRPILGYLAAYFADTVLITSDNPRYENPRDIIEAIYEGVSPEHREKVQIEVDRAGAIRKAYALSRPGSIIALLGKGPDEYQIVNGEKHAFSERSIIRQFQ